MYALPAMLVLVQDNSVAWNKSRDGTNSRFVPLLQQHEPTDLFPCASGHKSITEFRRMHREAVTQGAELARFARSCGWLGGYKNTVDLFV